MTFRERWASFQSDPFGFFDNLRLEFRGFKFNVIREDARMRTSVFIVVLVATGLWVAMGFDSGAGQIQFPLMHLPELLAGKITFQEWAGWYSWAYGKYLHWSFFTIYGLGFLGLSHHYARHGIHGSRNFVYSFGVTIFSCAVFEWFWMISYYVWQNQPWILTWKWPQLRILLQNTALTVVGAFAIFYMWLDSLKTKDVDLTPAQVRYFKRHWLAALKQMKREIVGRTYTFRLDWKTGVAVVLALVSCLSWWFYPEYVESLTVETATGPWTNSRHFPQTVYTVDMDPLDSVNAGDQFFLENNMVHLVNTLAKGFVTLAVTCFCLVVPKEEKGVA